MHGSSGITRVATDHSPDILTSGPRGDLFSSLSLSSSFKSEWIGPLMVFKDLVLPASGWSHFCPASSAGGWGRYPFVFPRQPP